MSLAEGEDSNPRYFFPYTCVPAAPPLGMRQALYSERASGFGQFSRCQYLAPGERIGDLRSATVQVHQADLASKLKAFIASGEKAELVPGIGEAAFWMPDQGLLYVQEGELTAAFAVRRAGVDPLEATRQLAAKVLSRMP